MGGLCQEGHDFLRLCKKRNKSATLRLLDVLATQHAKWTARRIRRALFGQSLVDFSGPSWSSVKVHAAVPEPEPVNRRKKLVSRMMQEFSQAQADTEERDFSPAVTRQPGLAKNCHALVPGMSQYGDSQEIFTDSDVEHVGIEDILKADQVAAAASQRTEYFELSP